MVAQRGTCVVALAGCAWLLPGGGGMHGCSEGGHAWLLQGVGCVWLLPGGHTWLLLRVCMVAPGGMHGCSGGMCGCSGGACMVAPGGACMVALGSMRGCSWGGTCVVAMGVSSFKAR